MIVTTGLALIYESIANYIAGGVEQTLPSNLRAFGQMPGEHHSGTSGMCSCLHFLKLHKRLVHTPMQSAATSL